MDKKAKEEEKRQKEVIKGDPAIRKLSRKERRKASQLEREKEREAARVTGTRVLHHDPYRESRRSPTYDAYPRSRRSRSRSRSHSPSYSRRRSRGRSDDGHRSKAKTPKIEYITEFGGSPDRGEAKAGRRFSTIISTSS
ncbi:Voltage-dependent calcium channel type A subunit alpha-1 [Bienertia sinuspersici]